MGARRAILRTVLALALGGGALTAIPGAQAAEVDGCHRGSAAGAATALFGAGATAGPVETVGGFRSVAAHVPEIVVPGVTRRMVLAAGRWCDATRGFNRAWAISGRPGGDLERAEAFVAVASAPYFDGVSVRSRRAVRPGVVALTTHARTNGVLADWVIRLDGAGISRAAWTARALAVEPFEPAIEGLTALPGARQTFARDAAGVLSEVIDVAALATASTTDAGEPVPGVELSQVVTMSDGFAVRVTSGDSSAAVVVDRDTGVGHLDFVRMAGDLVRDNYETHLGWGFRKGWTPAGLGVFRVDDAISAYCLACVAYSPQFNVHMSSEIVRIFTALGYAYPDARLAVSDIIGHEIVHNFQAAHAAAGGADLSELGGAYVEGVARATEAFHGYSYVSHQPRSLVYDTGINGCNGYLSGPDTGMSRNASRRLYDACYLWLAVYADHGIAGITRMLDASASVTVDGANGQIAGLLEAATGKPAQAALADFAVHALTLEGYEWGAADGSSAPLDWARHLDRWQPGSLSKGQSRFFSADGGSVVGARVFASGVLNVTNAPGATILRVTAAGGTTPLASGDTVLPDSDCAEPPSGQVGACAIGPVWVVVVTDPAAPTRTVGLSLS